MPLQLKTMSWRGRWRRWRARAATWADRKPCWYPNTRSSRNSLMRRSRCVRLISLTCFAVMFVSDCVMVRLSSGQSAAGQQSVCAAAGVWHAEGAAGGGAGEQTGAAAPRLQTQQWRHALEEPPWGWCHPAQRRAGRSQVCINGLNIHFEFWFDFFCSCNKETEWSRDTRGI